MGVIAITNLNGSAEPFNVSITPNPARGQMTITTDYEKGKASVVIINPQGVKVRGFTQP